MTTSITVWVAERGIYSDRGVVGVYATAEVAMEDNPLPTNPRYVIEAGGWQRKENGTWENGLDYDEYVSIQPWPLHGAIVFSADK